MDELRRRLFLMKKQGADRDAEIQARLDDTGTIRRYLRLADQVLQGSEAVVDELNPKTPAA